MPSFYELMLPAIRQGRRFALGIISGVKGSSPQKVGAKALFFEDGAIVGTLGGGCLEAEVRRRAFETLRTGQPAAFDLVLDHDFGWDDGLICGGKVQGCILPEPARAASIWETLAARQETRTWGVRSDYAIDWCQSPFEGEWLYREQVSPPCELWVAGAGHIGRAVAPLALPLDFRVTVFDDRPALTNREFFPPETRLRVDYWETLLQESFPRTHTFGLIVTRGHQHDALVLRHWIQRPFAFLGMIGSGRKKRIIFSHFLAEKIATEAQLNQVACPVGLDIQSVSVPEIAVSIMAQYIQKRAELMGKSARAHTPAELEASLP
jgi:xanthine dehydrogenase accessory factor